MVPTSYQIINRGSNRLSYVTYEGTVAWPIESCNEKLTTAISENNHQISQIYDTRTKLLICCFEILKLCRGVMIRMMTCDALQSDLLSGLSMQEYDTFVGCTQVPYRQLDCRRHICPAVNFAPAPKCSTQYYKE